MDFSTVHLEPDPQRTGSPTRGPFQILHVEVGGSYGGSLRALEQYLAYSDHSRFKHDALLYYPTPGMERLAASCRKVMTLYPNLPSSFKRTRATSHSTLRNGLRNSRLAPVLLEAREWLGLVRALPIARRLRKVLVSTRYDLIDVNNSFTYQASTLIAAKLVRIPVVAHMRNPIDANAFSRAMMRLTDCVVTVNNAFERELRSWEVPVAVRTCHDSVEIPVVDERISSQLRAALGAPGSVLVGSAGRLDPQKGYADFIRAARLVFNANPSVRFAIAGDGPLRASLTKLIDELGLAGIFHLCGFREDVGSFLAALDIFVCSSHWEGGPLAVIEAMLLGKPVVATDVGCTSEIVLSNETGDLIPSGEPKGIAEAILTLAADKDLRGRLGSAAATRVEHLSNMQARARDLNTIFESTLICANDAA